MTSLQIATANLYDKILGRYVTNEMIFPFLETLNADFKIDEIGKSVLGKTIKSVQFGNGKMKILMWSQMHGNESTTTKGLVDFLNYMNNDHDFAQKIKKSFTLYCIPILNPDGAALYTRANANEIDLNRDAKDITQPESMVLRKIYEEFQPDFCFNLHDQRTIFGVADTGKPATMSFLAPAYNETREYNNTRLQAIKLINCINTELQHYIPGQIGRFDDSFNENCIGDYLTAQNTPTILFEAGHFQNDYERDEVRKFVFVSLYSVLLKINENDIVNNELDKYLKIPQNNACFFDFIYKNIKVLDKSSEKIINFAAQYKEVLKENKISFVAEIVQIENLENFIGHFEFDGKKYQFESEYGFYPVINSKADFSLNNMLKFHNGLQLF